MTPPAPWLRRSLVPMLLACASSALADVVINEIHYHPIEEPAFDASGNPTLDLTHDVHEFVEIHNTGAADVDLSGWKLIAGAEYTVPAGTIISAGGYRIFASNPARLATVYGLSPSAVLGPAPALSNKDDAVSLQDASGNAVDSVNYRSSFPWAGSADGLGADADFTLINRAPYQYKGRSLERFSVTAAGNDPANWLASPLASGPTPGMPNTVTGVTPKPVVIAFHVGQLSDESAVIRQNQQVRVTFTMSSTAALSQVEIEFFVDNVNSYSEPRSAVPATTAGDGVFTATLPGQLDRSVVRWRVRADRGSGVELVSPRTDDVALVPTGLNAREAWHAYFVTPVRTSSNPIYDVLVSNIDSTSGAFNGLNGLAALNYNIIANPKRVTSSAPSGLPRALPYVPATAPLWNGTVPAIFIENGNVRDVQIRYHGSRYNRSAGRNSWKLRYADNQKHQDADSVFITDKSDYFSVMHGMFINANLPMSDVRWIDWYLNNNGRLLRLEQGEYNGDLLARYHERIQQLTPGSVKEPSGEFFKSVGTIDLNGEGPYGRGDQRRLFTGSGWTDLQRYEWTYAPQNHGWKGMAPFKTMLDGLWTARGDTHTAPNPNIANLRGYLDTIFDMDAGLSAMALLNWACPWDDTTQNHFLWRRANGRWTFLPWDFDAFFGNGDTTGTNSWIYLGEVGTPPVGILGNNSRGANFFKDSIFKAYRAEYNQRLWLLNNTYLHPDNLKTLFYRNSGGTQQSYYNFINGVKAGFCEARFQSVNTQTGHAANGSDFTRPAKPALISPIGGVTALPPATLAASSYAHTSGNTSGTNAHARSKWEIRSASGNYLAPVFVTTSTTALTSLSIPFDRLTFGQVYFWRVTYYDGLDHPSLAADESSFAFGPQAINQTLIAFGDSWKYDQTESFNDPAWAQPGYDDGTAPWLTGQGVLAFANQVSIPETIRTTLAAPRSAEGRATIYFRRHFNIPVPPATLTNLRIRHLIDDGCVIYINGVRVHRYRMADLGSYPYTQLSNSMVGNAALVFADASNSPGDSSYIDPRPHLVQGDNVIAVEVHQNPFIAPGNAGNSSDVTFGLEMMAAVPALPGDVTINEVMADNRSAVANAEKYPDWIELRNNTAAPIDVGGNGLTDDILNPGRYVFPAGTTIPAGDYLVIWCDNDTAAPGLHTGFGIDNGGQRVVLTNAGAIRDYVTFGAQATNLSVGRISNGTGPFTLTLPTPGAANTAVTALGSTSNLRLNEWMARPAHGDDWFELYNADPNPVSLTGLWVSDTPGTPRITQLPPLSFIAGKGCADFAADGTTGGGNHVDFQLAGGGDWLVLSDVAGTDVIDSLQFGSQTSNVSQGRFPDGGVALQTFPVTSSRGESNWLPASIVINEALTNSSTPFEDAIELHNPTASLVDISGWWLSDDKTALQKFQMPANSRIAAGGFMMVYENQFNPTPGLGNSFSLSSMGDEIILSAADVTNALTGFRSEVDFGAAADGVSFGRVVTSGNPEFWPLTVHTFGQDAPGNVAQFRTGAGLTNASPRVGPLIINEVMYHPPDLPEGGDNARDEFIELHNRATLAVDVSGWKIKGGSDFTFPNGISIRPGDYVLVVSFDPLTDAVSLGEFHSTYNLSAGTRIYGPFAPKLENDSQDVDIAQPGQSSGGTTPYILVDKTVYADFAPWPSNADGDGPSLERISRSVIGNDAANWIAAGPTPGRVNSGQTPIADNDGDGIPNIWEDANGLDKFSDADASLDADHDGQSNGAEYFAGTNPQHGGSFFRPFVTPLAGGFQISFTQQAGKTYRIEARSSLNSGSWQHLVDVPAASSAQTYTYNDTTSPARRFYRVLPGL